MRKRPLVVDDRPVILFVSHIGGGGTERHVRDLATRLDAEGVRAVVARPDGEGHLCFEEYNADWSLRHRIRITPTREKILSVLQSIQPGLVHVHHRLGVPETLFETIQEFGLPHDWTLHDYHAVCPRIHLNASDGRYCGEPAPEGCRACLEQLGDYHGRPTSPDVIAWRDAWRHRLRGARRLYVPSEDVGNRLSRYFPELHFHVRPHPELSRPGRSLARIWTHGERVRVAVIGSIVQIKGSGRLLAAAEDARTRNLPLEFVLVGTSVQEGRLMATGRVQVTGPYMESEIWSRLEEACCHLAWLPSTWPETYMYTLSAAMAAGLWPIVYDLGAQAERVAKSGFGFRMPLDSSAVDLNGALLEQAAIAATGAAHQTVRFAEYAEFMSEYYGLVVKKSKLTELAQATPPTSTHSSPALDILRSNRARLY